MSGSEYALRLDTEWRRFIFGVSVPPESYGGGWVVYLGPWALSWGDRDKLV